LWALTIHSSRRRFAARLNSGVRPLKSLLPTFHGRKGSLITLRGSGYCDFQTARVAAVRQFRNWIVTRQRRCARVFFGFSRCVKSVLWQQALRASPLCPAVFRLRVAVRPCSNVLRAYSSFLQVHRVRSRARAPRLREVRRPNSSFKPTPLHGREFFRYVAFSVAAVQRRGLTQVLDL